MNSESLTLTSRVLQGSVLGPLLFLIYVNHLPNIVYSSVALLLVDDLKVILQGNYKTFTKLQNDLNNLHCWSIQNHLLFNYKKYSPTDFKVGKRAKPPVPAVFMLGNNEIKAKTPVKDVELVISENLSLSDFLNCRIGKAIKAFFLVQRSTSSLLTLESKINRYRVVTFPILFFASECWEPQRSEFHIVEKFHKKSEKTLRK